LNNKGKSFMKHKALVLALLSATTSVPGSAHAADDNICTQLLIYAINQFCQLLPNGQSLCQPVALAGPSPSCELPDAQASMVQVPVGPPSIQFPALPGFGGAQNYYPPNVFGQFPYPQFPNIQFPYPQFPYPQFPVAQYPQAGHSYQPPASPVFPYPDYSNPYFPFAANPSAPPVTPLYAIPPVPPAAATIQPIMPAASPPPEASPEVIAAASAPAPDSPPVVSPATVSAVLPTTVETPPTQASASQTQAEITPVEAPAASVAPPSPTQAAKTADKPADEAAPTVAITPPAQESAPIVAVADAAMPATAADQAAAAEKARQDALAHFEFDSAELTPRGRAMLDEWLTQPASSKPVLVTGHADRLGPEPYNERLSLLRAEAVKQYLTQKGKQPQFIEIKAKGEKMPLIDCAGDANPETKACLAPNRRAEVTFKPLAKPARKAVKPLSNVVKPGSKR
jgi:OmpA-OmpF porin, OOP family